MAAYLIAIATHPPSFSGVLVSVMGGTLGCFTGCRWPHNPSGKEQFHPRPSRVGVGAGCLIGLGFPVGGGVDFLSVSLLTSLYFLLQQPTPQLSWGGSKNVPTRQTDLSDVGPGWLRWSLRADCKAGEPGAGVGSLMRLAGQGLCVFRELGIFQTLRVLA